MRKKIIGLALATFLIAVGLLATTAIVGAQSKSSLVEHHKTIVFDLVFLSSSPPGPLVDLDIGTVRIVEFALFQEGGEGDSIGNLTSTVVKTKPAGIDGRMEDGAFDFFGRGTVFTTGIIPDSFPGLVVAITGGTGEFQGANGECTFVPGSAICDLAIIAPHIPD